MAQERMGALTPKKMVKKEIEEGMLQHEVGEAVENPELTNEILEKLKGIDFRNYLYAQCKSAVGRDLGVEEEDLLSDSLILPAHWKVNNKDAETLGTYAGAGCNETDAYYTINPDKVIASTKSHEFEIDHTSISGNTHIKFTIAPDEHYLRITDIKAFKASPNTMDAVEKAVKLWNESQKEK